MLLRAPTGIAISREIEIKKAFCKAISRQVLHPKSQGRLSWEIWKLNAVNIPSRVAQRLQPFLFPKITAASHKSFLSHGCPRQVKQPQGLKNSSRLWGQLGMLRPRDLDKFTLQVGRCPQGPPLPAGGCCGALNATKLLVTRWFLGKKRQARVWGSSLGGMLTLDLCLKSLG